MGSISEVISDRLGTLFDGKNESEIGIKIGVDRTTVSSYLHGRTVPSADTLRLIAKEFNVSVDWIMGLKDSREILSGASNYDSFDYLQVLALAKDLLDNGSISIDKSEIEVDDFHVKIHDPIILYLIGRLLTIKEVGLEDFYPNWFETKLQGYKETLIQKCDEEMISYFHSLSNQSSMKEADWSTELQKYKEDRDKEKRKDDLDDRF